MQAAVTAGCVASGDAGVVRALTCSATALTIHLGVAAVLATVPPSSRAANPPPPGPPAVLVPFEPSVEPPRPAEPEEEPEPEVVRPPPPRARKLKPPKAVAEEPPREEPAEAEPEAAPAPAAGAPTEAPAEASGIASTEGGLAVAGREGRGGQGGTGHARGEPGGRGDAPAVDRRALLALYRRMLDEAIATPPPVRGVREPLDVTVVVALTIDSGGRLVRTRLNRSSGYPGIDEHALEFLASVRHLPAPPEALEWKRGTVLYPIRVIVR